MEPPFELKGGFCCFPGSKNYCRENNTAIINGFYEKMEHHPDLIKIINENSSLIGQSGKWKAQL
jgi:hypothetical protein